MLRFSGLFLCVATVLAVEFGENGLHFDYNSAYAASYDNYQPRDYEFSYGVADPHTGDHKSQWEVKNKGVVRGGYSLLEPDGSTRIVEYIADDHGFRAIVKKVGLSIHPSVEAHGFEHAPVEAPIVAAAAPVALPEPAIVNYHSYDGQVDNYAGVLNTPVQHIEPVSYVKPIEIPQTIALHGYQEPQTVSYGHQVPVESQGYGGNLDGYAALSSGNLGYGEVTSQPQAQGLYLQLAPSHIQVPHEPVEHYSVPQADGLHLAHHQQVVAAPVSQAEGLHLAQHQQVVAAPVPYYPAPIQQHQVSIPTPAYSSVQYYGKTGNPDDDSAYTNYDHASYQGAYSQKIQKVVPSPVVNKLQARSIPKPTSFVIHYP